MSLSTSYYRQITTCTESYFDRLGDSPLGMGWPNLPDAQTRYDVMLGVRRNPAEPIRLLDFGCGTGHLYSHIQRTAINGIDYHGIDLSSKFISTARERHPEADFRCADVLNDPAALGTYDYAVINGVFTSKCEMSFESMFGFVQDILRLLFSRVRCGMAFNAMSKQVDWERDDLFHLPMDELAWFLCRNLSRHFVIRNDYGLYEYTTYVYQDGISQP